MRDGAEFDDMTTRAEFPVELLVWLSPTFPVGAYAYSQGLEFAVGDGAIHDVASLTGWLEAVTRQGALWNDLVLLSLVQRAEGPAEIDELAELSLAMQPSKERADEARVQGAAFAAAYASGWAKHAPIPAQLTHDISGSPAVALGIAARAHGIPLDATLPAYASAYQANAVSAAIRLSVIGQFDAQAILANLIALNKDVCAFARTATIGDLGGATFAADLASLLHETQRTRLFRS